MGSLDGKFWEQRSPTKLGDCTVDCCRVCRVFRPPVFSAPDTIFARLDRFYGDDDDEDEYLEDDIENYNDW